LICDCATFSPPGRRWRRTPAAGAKIAETLIASHMLGTSSRWGEVSANGARRRMQATPSAAVSKCYSVVRASGLTRGAVSVSKHLNKINKSTPPFSPLRKPAHTMPVSCRGYTGERYRRGGTGALEFRCKRTPGFRGCAEGGSPPASKEAGRAGHATPTWSRAWSTDGKAGRISGPATGTQILGRNGEGRRRT
jgi:hypothetical protein